MVTYVVETQRPRKCRHTLKGGRMSDTSKKVRYDVADGIATITIDDPERRNAFTALMCLDLIEAFDKADADDAVRVVIVTGEGKTFCPGADLHERFPPPGQSMPEYRLKFRREQGTINGAPRDAGGVLSLRIARMRKVVIGAVNGAAVGIGVTMLLPMDIRIASDRAKMGLVFTRRGLVPEAASSWFLPRVVGISQAMEWVASGRVFDAQEAKDGGLVSRVVPADQLLDTARAIAREIADNTSSIAVGSARQMLWSMLSASSPWEGHNLDSQALDDLSPKPDVTEGVASFLERRDPVFPMRVSDDFPAYIPPWPQRPEHLGE